MVWLVNTPEEFPKAFLDVIVLACIFKFFRFFGLWNYLTWQIY